MATIKKAQAGIKKSASKMVPGEMTGKMYKKSEIDEIGRKQAKELDKSGVFGKAAMAKKKASAKTNNPLKEMISNFSEAEIKKAKAATKKPKLTAAKVSKAIDEVAGMKNGGMLKRADGSYSKRGLWDNIRANKGSGKKPTAAMLKQEKKIKAKTKK
jgi:hypothetical protein